MRPIWKLLANNGGDLVLNGHTHAMEVYGPLDGKLNADQADSTMWQIVSGAGGHAMTSAVATDPRNVWQKTKTPGALYMKNVGGAGGNATEIQYAFRNVAGNVIWSGGQPGRGTIDCGDGGDPGDTQRPTTPGRATGGSNSPGSIDITWAASTDDLTTSLTYYVYRDWDPTPVGSVVSASTGTVSFTDQGRSPGSSHWYRMAASEGANSSWKSNARNRSP
jgi:hypothetical protein